MRNIAFVFSLSFLSINLSAQSFSVTVTGSVTYSDGMPASSVDVFISAVFDDSTFYFVTALTNDEGVYEEVIPIPDGQTEGEVSISSIGCNGMFGYFTLTWTLNDPVIVQDFVWCEIIEISDSCFVLILPSYDPLTGVTTLYAIGSALEPVTYLWNDGSTGQSITPIDTGTYCVTITGADGCITSGCYEYSGGSGCFVSISAGNGGFFDTALVAFGYGVEPLTYVWSTGDTGQVLIVSEEGTYCVTMTDATGCSASACAVYIPLPCYVWISEDPGGLTAYTFGTDPFTFLWNTGEITQSITPGAPGLYCVTATDAEGCGSYSCYDYYPFSYCDVILSYTADSINGTIGDLLWAFSYGIPPFDYQWSTGDTTESITLDSLIPGICVTVTDATGCVDSSCTDELLMYCYAWISVAYENDSIAVLTVTTYPYDPAGEFEWSTGDSTESITVNEAGEYCVDVQTSYGCATTACAYVDFQMGQDSCFAFISAYQDPATGLYILEGISWGIPPYNYAWSTGDTVQTITIDAPNMPVCVTITDASGCVSEACVVTIDNPLCQVWIDAYPVDTSTWMLTAQADPFLGVSAYLWSNGETSDSILVSESGQYCVTITTSDGCTSSACLYLNIQYGDTLNSDGVIHGYIFTEDQAALTGFAELYQVVDPMTGATWSLRDSAMIEQGNFYVFGDIPPGLYAVRAIAQPLNSTSEYFPTYYYHTVEWEEADVIAIPNLLTVLYDILLVPTTIIDGPGVITGSLIDPDGILAAAIPNLRSSGLGTIQITLSDGDGMPLRFTHTDMAGDFAFESLPWGEYRVRFEVAGIPSPELWITLSPESPNVNGVILSSAELNTTGTQDLQKGRLSVSPQPALDLCRIQVPGPITEEHVLTIINVHGQTVKRITNVFNHVNDTWIDIRDLDSGFYIVKVQADERIWLNKLIKHSE